VSGVFTAQGSATPGCGSPPDDLEAASSAANFADIIRGRAALTDPETGSASKFPGAAPQAVAFDHGQLFARAVDVPLMPVAAATPTGKNDRTSQPAFVRFPADAKKNSISNHETGDLRETVEPAPNETLLASGAGLESIGRAGPAGSSGAPSRRAPEGEMSYDPSPKLAPLAQAGAASSPSKVALPPLSPDLESGRASSPGEGLREQAVAQLLPINFVIRALPGGIQIGLRVSGLSGDDAYTLKEAVVAALADEGTDLIELRVNGRDVLRGAKCQ
jgi:hypothetical protein